MSKGYSIDIKRKKCVTPEGRAGYVALLEKRALPQSEDEAYGIQLMLPKTEEVEEFIKELKQVYVQVLLDKFGPEKAKNTAQLIAAKNKFPVRDGDDPKEADLANAEQLKGHYFINTNNRFKQPHIIGPMGKSVDPSTLTTDDIYSGMWGRAMLEFWYYDTAGNKGISTSIAAFMKTKDDDNLGAGTTSTEAEDAFGDFSDEAASMFSADSEPEDKEPDSLDEFNFI